MKSKKWLISLSLAVALVMALALPACTGEPTEYWHTPIADGDQKIEFGIGVTGWYADVGLMVVQDLQDFGMDVELQTLDSTTYYDYLYDPPGGGMEAFVSAEDPSPDPWGDWIWMMLGDPLSWGLEWNPTWWTNSTYDDLFQQNYFAANETAKKEILFGLQEILAEEIPVVFLVREKLLSAYRTDKWENWYNEMGGLASWINEYSIREVTPVDSATRLNIGCSALPGNLLMEQEGLMYTHVGCLYLMLVYENLVGYPKLTEGTAYDFVPKLATNYTVTYEADGMGDGGQNQVWTYDLREGVKWHDYDTAGKNFTADDVVYSIKYVQFKWANNRPVNWTAVGDADDILPDQMLVTKTGDYQVQLRYVEGYHQNESFVPCAYLWYAFVPKHVFDAIGAPEDPTSWHGNYTGTGPYMVKEYEAGSHLLLERFDDYWGADDPLGYWELPAADEVLFQLYENEGPFWIAFEAGAMDSSASFSVPHPKKAAYDADADITLEVVSDLSVYYLGFNLHETGGYAPLQELALRQAIAAAVDKEDIIAITFGSYGEVADGFVYLESPNHHPSLPNNEYDLTEAASILTAAGYTKHA